MDPKSADALTAVFLEFDSDKNTSVAVFARASERDIAPHVMEFLREFFEHRTHQYYSW
jgi:hypothetical protein